MAIRDVMLPLYPNYGDYIHDNVHSRDFGEMKEGYPESLRKTVEEIMSKNPLTVSPTACILEAASIWASSIFAAFPSLKMANSWAWSV